MSTADVALQLYGDRKASGNVCNIESGTKGGISIHTLEKLLKIYNCEIVFKEN